MRPTNAFAAAVLSLLVGGRIAACGDSSVAQSSEEQPAGETQSVHHIHGLGVGPGNGSLYLATHTGLFDSVTAATGS